MKWSLVHNYRNLVVLKSPKNNSYLFKSNLILVCIIFIAYEAPEAETSVLLINPCLLVNYRVKCEKEEERDREDFPAPISLVITAPQQIPNHPGLISKENEQGRSNNAQARERKEN